MMLPTPPSNARTPKALATSDGGVLSEARDLSDVSSAEITA